MLVLSVLVHWWLLGGLKLGLWQTQDETRSVTTINITLDNVAASPDIAPASVPEIVNNTPEPNNPIPPTVETPTPPQPVLAETDQPLFETTVPDSEANTSAPAVDSSVLRRQLFASIRQPSETSSPSTSELPTNWTQDALPSTGVEQPALLEPLTYTGPVTSERWKGDDGQPQTRTVLADGTVVCGRGHTLLPNSDFEANVMLMRTCGKEKGGRKNKNQLARYHPNYVDEQESAQSEPQQ